MKPAGSATVAESHGMDLDAPVSNQEASQRLAAFPITIENEGATFRCVVMDQTPSEWTTRFVDDRIKPSAEVQVPARGSLDVSSWSRSKALRNATRRTSRHVVNLDHNGAQDDDGDGLDNQKEVNFVAERFDKVYSMDVSSRTPSPATPPASNCSGGSMSVGLWVRNTGNASMDMAVPTSAASKALPHARCWSTACP